MSGQTDTERLEWMANRQLQFLNLGPHDDDPRQLVDEAGNVLASGNNIRAIIDAAMDAEERG